MNFQQSETIQRSSEPKEERPSFISGSKKAAFLFHNLFSGFGFEVDVRRPSLPRFNAAMPHRMSWMDIRNNTELFAQGDEGKEAFLRWTNRFIEAGEAKIAETEQAIEIDSGSTLRRLEELLRRQKKSQNDFIRARDAYVLMEGDPEKKAFLKQANSFHANVPDLGPHEGVNNPVRQYTHLHFRQRERSRSRSRSRQRKRGRSRQRDRRSLSPMSRRVLDMSPGRLSGIAATSDDEIITVTGETVDWSSLSAGTQKKMQKHGTHAIFSFNPDARFR